MFFRLAAGRPPPAVGMLRQSAFTIAAYLARWSGAGGGERKIVEAQVGGGKVSELLGRNLIPAP